MLAATLDGYGLTALIVIAVVVILLARIGARIMHDHGIRIARIGVFIERQRVIDPETWSVDPLDPEGETRPVPIPPPTPPPPIPPQGEEPTRVDWPEREERP